MKTSAQGRQMIRDEEGFRPYAYPDPLSELARTTPHIAWGYKPARELFAALPGNYRALNPAPWTVGFGQTVGVDEFTSMTVDEAEADLDAKLPQYEALVNTALTYPPTQVQFDALVCLAWNCPAALDPKKSSIVKAHNRGDFEAAGKAFELYNKSGGRVSPALVNRRRREAVLYLRSTVEIPLGTSPQVVDEPKPLTASKINIASTTAGAVASVGAVTQVLDAIKQFKDGVDSLGTWLMPVAFIAIIIACGVVVWQRIELRNKGVV